MSPHRSLSVSRTPFGRIVAWLSASSLAVACSGAPPPSPAAPTPEITGPAAPAGAPGAVGAPAPRFATDAIAVDFQHPARETALAALLPRLGERIDAFYAAQKPPSVAVAFVADGEVRLSRVLGFADIAGKVAASPHTLYRIGSITKTFTTALVMSLRDEGKLELDHPAEQYWPELMGIEYPFPDAARITLRHLLTHSSGLPRLGDFDYTKPDSPVTDATLLGALARARLDAAPGTAYVYSNFGMSLVGFFAGRLSSEGSLRAAVSRRLTGPLGMSSTTFDPASLAGAAVATPYATSAKADVAPLWNLGVSEGAGGLWSSLDDMARWVLFQLSAWPPRPGPELGPLRRSTLREQHVGSLAIGLKASPEGSQATASGIGLGWHTRRSCDLEHLVEHGGAIDGFRAAVGFAPERGFGVVVLANALDAPVQSLQDELLKLAAASLPAREQRPAPDALTLLGALAESVQSCPASAHEALFTRGFRDSVGLEQYQAVCGALSKRHGRCEVGETLSLTSPHQGEFMLRCERGAIRASANVVTEDGASRFGGLLVRSTGFPASPALARATQAAVKLYERWDDALFGATFANPGVKDALRSGFAQIRAERGRCSLGRDALTGPYGNGETDALLPIVCERGGPVNVAINVDAGGKITGIFVREPEGSSHAGCG